MKYLVPFVAWPLIFGLVALAVYVLPEWAAWLVCGWVVLSPLTWLIYD